MSKKSLVSLTNIPTPYRIHFYQALSSELLKRNINLDVIFMAHTEPGRYWELDENSWGFPYEFSSGVHPSMGGRIFHFNPAGLYALWRKPPDWLLLSGSWFLPTVQFATLLSKFNKTKTLFWSESNLAYVEHEGGLANRWRRWTLDLFDGFVVPGLWAKDYVHHFAPLSKNKPFLQLPNVVNEQRFRDEISSLRANQTALRRKWGIKQADQVVLLTIARLEPIKGIEQLVQAALTGSSLGNLVLLIAGTGSLQDALINQVEHSGLADRVRLLGHLPESSIQELLALADGFILPSLGDPYPLVVIEAAFAGLPLLLSNRVGCHPEALIEEKNGFLFDPEVSDSIQNCLRSFLMLGSNKWHEMGQESARIAAKRFETSKVIKRFVDELMQKL